MWLNSELPMETWMTPMHGFCSAHIIFFKKIFSVNFLPTSKVWNIYKWLEFCLFLQNQIWKFWVHLPVGQLLEWKTGCLFKPTQALQLATVPDTGQFHCFFCLPAPICVWVCIQGRISTQSWNWKTRAKVQRQKCAGYAQGNMNNILELKNEINLKVDKWWLGQEMADSTDSF